MKFLTTILVLIGAYTLINGKPSTGTDLVDNIDRIFQAGNTLENRPMGPDLTPTPLKNDDEYCLCYPSFLCNKDLPVQGKPCIGSTCGAVSMRMNDGSCAAGLVRCCRGGIRSSVETPPVVNTIIPNQIRPNLNPGNKPTDYCPCIPSYQCENGIPCTDGCDAIDPKINDGTCSDPSYVRCCKELNNGTAATPINLNQIRPNLNPGNKPPSCPCVPYFQCENGTPCTDGCDAIDAKINDDTCSDPSHVRCCKGLNNGTTATSINSNQIRPNLNPGNKPATCPCIHSYQCENGIPCTDGCDVIDMKINDGTCPLPYVLCCKEGNNVTVNPVSTTIIDEDKMSSCPCLPYYQCYNGTPCTDGCNVIDLRINDGTCSDPSYVRCCTGVNVTATPAVSPMVPNTNSPDLTPKNQLPSCPCINHYNCYNGTPCTDGCGVIDMRMNHDSCKPPNVLCCKQNNTSVHNMNVSPSKNNIEPTPSTSDAPKRRSCGIRNPNGIGFRRSDSKTNLAYFGEFPWMVAILWEDKDTSDTQGDYPDQTLLQYQCGGSLIHPQVVLTSTHCVVSKEKTYQIRAGEWDIKNTEETYPHQDRMVEKVIIHPDYYSGGYYNDIALLILETPVLITKNVDTICLPAQDEILEDVRCYTSGWGTNVFQMNGQYETTLKKVLLPIVKNDLCQNQLRKAREQDDFILHESFICAGGVKNQDACDGDGGSPLTCPFSHNTERYFQAGIVTWGIGCGLENVPGVYANVARFRNWVDEHMIKLGYDTSYYTY